jgi:hypothetical protein
MGSKAHLVSKAARDLASNIEDWLKVKSPAKKGPLSELGGPEGWGKRGAELYARGWSGIGDLMAGSMAGLRTPQMAAAGAGPSVGMSAGLTVNLGGITINAGDDVSPRKARQFGQDVADETVGALLSQAARLGIRLEGR